MRAEIKKIHSPDIQNLESYKPIENDNFGFLLQLFIGESHKEGADSFDLTVCTSKWIKNNFILEDGFSLKDHLIVSDYDFDEIKNYLENHINNLNETSWEKIAMKIDKIAHWEFRNYNKN